MTIDAAGGLQGDVVDGGAGGVERLLLGTPDPGVVVDLAAGTITGPGEPDTLVGIRNVWQSGAADATLLGDDGDNQLIGNGTLDGRGGNDGLTSRGRPSHLTGGVGNDGLSVGPGDVADGGPGDDLILPTWFVPFAPSRRATVVCGAGLDRWDPPIGGTPMPTDCESSPIGGSWTVAPPVRTTTGLAVGIKSVVNPTRACGYVVWARSPTTHKRITPLARGRLTRAVSIHTIRLPVKTATADIVATPATTCPRHGTWKTSHAWDVLMAVRGR